MRKIVHSFLIFLLLSLVTFGQETNTSRNFEKETFKLYSQKNWPELIQVSKEAIKEGYDYYYMRMRLAIAFYERHNYHRALIHFNKAYKFNKHDPYLLEYLYYANLFSGRQKAAYDITSEFSSTKKKEFDAANIGKFKIGELGINTVFSDLETGPELISDISRDQFGSQIFLNGFTKINLGFNHTVSRRFSLYYQYSFLMENRFYFYRDNSTAYYLQKQKLYENQFYILGNVYLGKNFNLYASVNYLRGNIPEYSSGWGASYFYAPGFKYNDFTSDLAIFKDFSYISFGLSMTYSYFQFNSYVQQGVFIRYYPLGNLNLYLTAGYQLKQKVKNGQFYEDGTFYEYKLGFKIIEPLWIEIEGMSGDLQNASTQLGAIVYNNPNPVNSSIGSSLLINLNKKSLWLKLSYYYINSTSHFITENNLPSDINTVNYNIHSLFGGLSWSF